MTNSNQRQAHDRSVHQNAHLTPGVRQGDRPASQPDVYNDDLANQTPEVVNGLETSPTESYRDGYVRGQASERQIQNVLETRDNDNASSGLLLGIILTSILGAVIAFAFFANQQNRAPETVTPAPAVPQAAPVEPEAPTRETNDTQVRERVIERTTREVVPVPVPQPQPPAPAPQAAPAPQPAPIQSQGDPAVTGGEPVPATGSQPAPATGSQPDPAAPSTSESAPQ